MIIVILVLSIVNHEANDKETFIKGLCASTAVPFVFPPVIHGDKVLMDGGVAWNLDVSSAI
jgi:predicted acylesterase/phospholipase RssA